MKRIRQYLAISYILLSICSNSENYGQPISSNTPFTIDIKGEIKNIKTKNLSTIGNNLSYIPLETTPKCLIQAIEKVTLTDLYIFVNESRRLLQFDNKGIFIRQIGSVGRGPEEYLAVGDFCIDDQKKEISIISAPKLLVFGFDGVFKYSKNLSFRPSQILYNDQHNLMFHLYNLSGKSITNDYSWIITDTKGTILMSIRNHLKRTSQPGLSVANTPLYLFQNMAHFLEFGIDTLYYFQDNIKKPYAIFNLEDLKMDPDPFITPSTKEEVGRKLFNKFWINDINENNNYLFVKFFRGITDSSMQVIFDKRTAEVTIIKDNVFSNDIDGGLDFWPRQIVNDKILIDYVDAFDLLKRIKKMQAESKAKKGKNVPIKLLNLGKQLTETSNPVLIILR
jgi:hypothetical protein